MLGLTDENDQGVTMSSIRDAFAWLGVLTALGHAADVQAKTYSPFELGTQDDPINGFYLEVRLPYADNDDDDENGNSSNLYLTQRFDGLNADNAIRVAVQVLNAWGEPI